MGQLHPVIDTHDLISIIGDNRCTTGMFCHGNPHQVCQIVFVLGILAAQTPDMGPQEGQIHTVDPAIHLINCLFFWAGILLFNNPPHAPFTVPDNPAIAKRPVQPGSQHRDCSAGDSMFSSQTLQRCSGQQRCITTKNQD